MKGKIVNKIMKSILFVVMCVFSIFPNQLYAKTVKPNKNVRVIIQFQERNRENILSKIKQIKNASVKYEYTDLIVGASIDLPLDEVQTLQKISGIEMVETAKTIHPYTFQAKELTQALAQSPKYKHDGRGMVIALLDSGMDTKHKDMRLDDGVEPKIKEITPSPKNEFTLKVPHGYDYINNRPEVIDETEHPHGMHLAGILAGNATDEEVANKTGIDGLAPNAQLLAYKVFSDEKSHSRGEQDDVVYAAMEDAIKHGADVISLSIGAYGIGKPGDTFYRAVEKAHERGIIVAAAMGNAAASSSDTSYDDYPNNALKQIDTATTVSVAANEYVIGVGSARNLALPQYKLLVNDLELGFKNIGTEKLVDGEYTIQYVKTSEIDKIYEMDLEDKIVLIDDEYKIVPELVARLKAQKVKGIILGNINTTWNSDYYEKYYVSKSEDQNYKGIWGATISGNDSDKLKKLLEKTKTVTIHANDKLEYRKILDKSAISGFSSWGPTVDLEMKPDLVAPGEDVYSTFNHNKYGLMSGTSMAAPHVAGASTILLPFTRQKPKPDGVNDADLVRMIMMNTAKPLEDTTSTSELRLENSPRQQGAGMLQIADAQNAEVVAYHNRKGAVSLKEIGQETQFTITLQNLSANSHSFKVKPGNVLTSKDFEVVKHGNGEERIAYEIHSAQIPNASLVSKQDVVTLGANEKVDVVFTLNTGDAKEQFAEGYVYFEPQDNHPTLTVPFLGFVGDWGKERIIDLPAWDKDSKVKETRFLTRYDGGKISLGSTDLENPKAPINPEMIAITSTNTAGSVISNAELRFVLLRDATELKLEILDKDKHLVKTIHEGEASPRFRYVDHFEESGYSNYNFDESWNGKIYNSKTGEIENAPEGQYYYRIQARNSDTKAFQEVLLPIKIDNTLPTMEVDTSELKTEHKIKIHATDNNKIWHVKASIDESPIKVVKIDDEHYEIQNVKFNDFTQNQLAVKAFDIAGNQVKYEKNLTKEQISFTNIGKVKKGKATTLDGVVSQSVAKIEAYLNEKSVTVTQNDKEFSVDMSDVKFGENKVRIVLKDNQDNILSDAIEMFIKDIDAPVFDLDVEYEDEDEDIIAIEDGKFYVRGTVTDDATPAEQLKVYYYSAEAFGNKKERHEIKLKADGSFDARFVRDDFKHGMILEAIDATNKKTIKNLNFDEEFSDIKEVPFTLRILKLNTFITKAGLNFEVTPMENGNFMYDVVAETEHEDYKIEVNGGEKQSPEDGVIHYNVELHPGFNPIRVNGYDDEDNLIFQRILHIYIDTTSPELTLLNLDVHPSEDKNLDGILYVNKPEVNLSGNVNDYGLYWYLAINENVLETGGEWLEFKETMKDFNRNIYVENDDILKVKAYDFFGNESEEKRYKIKFDTELPTLETNITNKESYEVNQFVPDVRFMDNNGISSQEVTLNGKPYKHNTPITEVGNYTLKYKAVDYAGNTIEDELKFRVDEKDKDTLSSKVRVEQIKDVMYYDEVATLALGDFVAVDEGTTMKLLTPIDVTKPTNQLKVEVSDEFGSTKVIDITVTLQERLSHKVLKADKNEELGQVEGNFSDQMRFIAVKLKEKVEALKTKTHDVYDLSIFNDRIKQTHKIADEVTVSLMKQKPTVEKVYYLDSENNLEELEFTQTDTMVSFKTNHFSKYVVVYADDVVNIKQLNQTQKNAVETSDSNYVYYIILGLGAVLGFMKLARRNKQ